MAAAVAPSASFSLKTQAAYPIRLGGSLSEDSDTKRYTSVRYNFKPPVKHSKASKAQIQQPATNDGGVGLSLREDDGTYDYAGTGSKDDDSFVLVLRGQGKEQEMVLERLNTSYGFNITKTPAESSASKLTKQHPHLPTSMDDADNDDLFGDEDEEPPLDEDNPFDYRHFLKAELDKLDTAAANADAARSSTNTPVAQAHAARRSAGNATATTTATVTKPSKRAEPKKATAAAKRRAAAAAEKPNPKRVKAGQDPQAQADTAPAKPKQHAPVPEVRIDRKASIRQAATEDNDADADDDAGELILENDTPTDEKPHRPFNAMSLALTGQLRSGPISLVSAASSPASRVASPMPPRPAGMVEEYEFDLGDSSPDASRPASRRASNAADDPEAAQAERYRHANHNDSDEDDDDADVEDLELPSPATRKHDALPPPPMPPVGDDDDELDKQLALAMMEEEEDDRVGLPLGNAESDEESEEE